VQVIRGGRVAALDAAVEADRTFGTGPIVT
jgi:hypothetical protein